MMKLILATVAEVAAFCVALIGSLYYIVTELERIGGSANSYLAKIRFGVRAIEKETSHLGPEVVGLNQRLGSIAGQLAAVDEHLGATAAALAARKGGTP
jgi:hypothetical protein